MARAAINVSAPGTRSSARREEIITVASRLLTSKGLNLSLQDIADELGITYNALYHHFKSRDDLLLHCFLRSAQLFDESLAEADQAPTGLEKVMAFLRIFLKKAAREATPPGRYAVALGEDAQRIVAKRSGAYQAKLVAMVEEGLADGSIAECDPLVTAVWILHTIYWWPEEARHHRSDRAIAGSVFRLIRRSLAA
jgi:AcrR family transcriptional regulator